MFLQGAMNLTAVFFLFLFFFLIYTPLELVALMEIEIKQYDKQ